MNDFKKIKQDAIDSMTACRDEAHKMANVVISQGIFLVATLNGSTLAENIPFRFRIYARDLGGVVEHPWNSLKLRDLGVAPVRDLIGQVIETWVPRSRDSSFLMIRFSLYSAFDGAHSVEDLRDGHYDVNVAEWNGNVEFDYRLRIWED